MKWYYQIKTWLSDDDNQTLVCLILILVLSCAGAIVYGTSIEN